MHGNYTSRVSQLNHEYALMAKVGQHESPQSAVDKRLRLPQPSSSSTNGSPATAPIGHYNGSSSSSSRGGVVGGSGHRSDPRSSPLVGGSISPAPRYAAPAPTPAPSTYMNGSPSLRPQSSSSSSRSAASPYRGSALGSGNGAASLGYGTSTTVPSSGLRSSSSTQREASYELFDQQLQETEML
jgi:hypothetical protein